MADCEQNFLQAPLVTDILESNTVTLYHYKDQEISISIDAYFEGDNLIIDGYDIGKKVKDYWGDSDYEYILTIPPAGVDFLFVYFNVKNGDKDTLLQTLARKFNTNTCYSDIRKLLDDNHIVSSGFSWT